MDKLELRARARAAARASGLFDDVRADDPFDSRAESRGRHSTVRARGVAPPPLDSIDEAQARAACRPMGELEYIVHAADTEGRTRAMYVVVPDLQLKPHYRRMGFEIEAGCRVLFDAEALVPIAVMRVCARAGASTPQRCDSPAGFNPYFDMPPA